MMPPSAVRSNSAPQFEIVDFAGRLTGKKLGHPPVVDVLSTRERVAKVGLPVILRIDAADRCRDAALGDDRVRLAEQRFAHDRHPCTRRRGLDRGAQPRTAGADDQHVGAVDRMLRPRHQISRAS